MKLIIIIILLLSLILISGCITGGYTEYKLQNNKIICCSYREINSAGNYFENCKDGLKYSSQTNIEIHGDC